MRKRAIAVIAAGTVTLLAAAGLAYSATTAYHASTALEGACAEAYLTGPWEAQECVSEYYAERVRRGEDTRTINRELQYRYLGGDNLVARGCHYPTHAVGYEAKMAYKEPPLEGLKGVFLFCDVGYAHGLTNEYDMLKPVYGENELRSFIEACATYTQQGSKTRKACEHGAGHIVATLAYDPEATPREWLRAGIRKCRQSDTSDLGSCVAGHLMVWNMLGATDLAENPSGWPDRWFTTWPDLCDTLTKDLQKTCLEVLDAAHAMYYGQGQRPSPGKSPYCTEYAYCPVPTPETTAERCRSYPDPLRRSCYQGLGGDRELQFQQTTHTLERICTTSSQREDQKACLLAALQSFEDPLTLERCHTLTEQTQWICPVLQEAQHAAIREMIQQRRLSQAAEPATTRDEFRADCLALSIGEPTCSAAVDRVDEAGAFNS